MEHLLFYNSKIVTFSLILCAVLATVGAMMIVRQLMQTSGTTLRHFLELRFRPSALRHTETFEDLLAGYQEVAELLGRYSPDYSAVFNEAHWSKLILGLEDLNQAYSELQSLLEAGESKEAFCLAEFLVSQGKELASWKYKYISEDWESLENWEHELHDIVRRVLESLWEAVLEARKLGISRGASTDETLAVLERIRAQL